RPPVGTPPGGHGPARPRPPGPVGRRSGSNRSAPTRARAALRGPRNGGGREVARCSFRLTAIVHHARPHLPPRCGRLLSPAAPPARRRARGGTVFLSTDRPCPPRASSAAAQVRTTTLCGGAATTSGAPDALTRESRAREPDGPRRPGHRRHVLDPGHRAVRAPGVD